MNDPIVPPILPPGQRLNPKTLRLVERPKYGISRATAPRDLLLQTLDAERHRRQAAELRAIDRKVDGFKQGLLFGGVCFAPVVAAALIAASRFFGWLP